MALVQQRREVVHTKLTRKYQKAINVYLRWSEDELAELDFSLKHSIDAGLQLGQESHRRSNYPGFPYDVDGTVYPVEQIKPQAVVVFGERFEGLKAALVHASKTYGLSQGKLAQGLELHNNNLEAVILHLQREQQQASSERELGRLCGAFAKEHNQSRRYVVNAVKRYMERDQELSVHQALEKLYQERVQHFK